MKRLRRVGGFLLPYTLLFALLFGASFAPFFVQGNSFIWEGDGWAQHYKALIYFGRWLRDIARGLLYQHQLIIPQWSFHIGLGSDIITTLHYYVVGDPLNLLAVFVPTRYTWVLYHGLIVLRFYLAGLAFAAYCSCMGQKNRFALLAGSFVYVFCGFALRAGITHPYFMNPMIYLPLLLVGVERVLRRNRPGLFLVMVFVCSVSNFYFLYMLAILAALYTVFRLFMLCDAAHIREAFFTYLKLIGYAGIGALMSAVLLLPVLLRFFTDSRVGTGYAYAAVYPLAYYREVLTSFVSYHRVGAWTWLGYSSVALLALFLLFTRRKQNTALKLGFVLLTLFVLLPAFGHMFNGFSYVANRWTWGYSLLVAYILVKMWDELLHLRAKDMLRLLALLVVYSVACLGLYQSEQNSAGPALLIALLVLLMLALLHRVAPGRGVQSAILVAVMLTVTVNGLIGNGPVGSDYASRFIPYTEMYPRLDQTEGNAIRDAAGKDKAFFRYSAPSNGFASNATLYNGMYSTQYYWSLSNPNLAELSEQLGLTSGLNYRTAGFYSRTAMEELASVKYFVTKKHRKVPYGYGKVGDYAKGDQIYTVYRNKTPLPLGYTYSGYLTQEKFDSMNAVQRQEALLQGVLLEREPEGYAQAQPNLSSQRMDYEIAGMSNNVTMEGNAFVVREQDGERKGTVKLTFQGLEHSETYLSFVELYCRGADGDDTHSRYLKDNDGAAFGIVVRGKTREGAKVKQRIHYYSPEFNWYNDRHNYAVNMGYHDEAMHSITIKLPKPGVYRFDQLAIFCQPMKNYTEQVEELRQDTLEQVHLETNQVSGTISLEQPKLLCLSIPYAAGWTAYVDGQETELLRANTMYMALPLTAGQHTVRLEYHTPRLLEGFVISCVGFVALVVLLLTRKILAGRRKRNA